MGSIASRSQPKSHRHDSANPPSNATTPSSSSLKEVVTFQLPSLPQRSVVVIVLPIAASIGTTMGVSLEQSPFLQALSGDCPQRIQSSVADLLKVLESGPRYINHLEEIVRFASGGSVTGAHKSPVHISSCPNASIR